VLLNCVDHPEIIRALLNEGARVNLPDAGQQTALHKAVLTGSKEDVAGLLDGGADANLMDNMGHSSMHVAVRRMSFKSLIFIGILFTFFCSRVAVRLKKTKNQDRST